MLAFEPLYHYWLSYFMCAKSLWTCSGWWNTKTGG